ncbi:MAG TPA: hypothetical protein VN903_31620 [Polyangia bacterium]|nr:hypothetical protein [Polyangia bacterium]
MSRVVVVSLVLCAIWLSTAHADERAISAAETPVRSAPFDVAPEIARLHSGDHVCGDDQVQGAWRRVGLPDGRHGFVRDADTQAGPNVPGGPCAPPPAPTPPTASAVGGSVAATDASAAAVSTQSTPVAVQRQEALTPPDGPHLLGVTFELFPVGTLSSTPTNAAASDTRDAFFAVGVAPFFDGALSPYISIGVSPQVIFRVRAEGVSGESLKEFDFRGRLTGRLPLSPKVRAFVRASPAYSLIVVPSPPSTSGRPAAPNPQGFLLDGSVGLEIGVLPNLFVVTDLGYQSGFQSSDAGDFNTSYLHLGAGFAIGL